VPVPAGCGKLSAPDSALESLKARPGGEAAAEDSLEGGDADIDASQKVPELPADPAPLGHIRGLPGKGTFLGAAFFRKKYWSPSAGLPRAMRQPKNHGRCSACLYQGKKIEAAAVSATKRSSVVNRLLQQLNTDHRSLRKIILSFRYGCHCRGLGYGAQAAPFF